MSTGAPAIPRFLEEERLAALHEHPEPIPPAYGRSGEQKRQFWRSLDARLGGMGAEPDSAPGRLGSALVMGQPIGNADPDIIRPPTVNPRPDKLLDTLELQHLADEGATPGTVKPARQMTDAEYPSELQDAMEFREPQFFLRNIPRAERFADDILEYDRVIMETREWTRDIESGRGPKHEPPQLLDEMNLERMQAYRDRIDYLFMKADWSRYFGHEIKKEVEGPLWRYDPDRQEEDDEPEVTSGIAPRKR